MTNITQRGRLDKLSPKRALKGAILAHYREEETGRWKPGWTLKIEQCRYGMQIVFAKSKAKSITYHMETTNPLIQIFQNRNIKHFEYFWKRNFVAAGS